MLRRLQKVAAFSAVLRKTAGIPKGLRELAAKADSNLANKTVPSQAQLHAATRAAAQRVGRGAAKAQASGDISKATELRNAGTGVREVSRDMLPKRSPKPTTPPPSTPAAQKPGVLGRIANHFKSQAGKHGVLPVAGSVIGGGMLMSSAAKAPSKYRQFQQGFRPENHQI